MGALRMEECQRIHQQMLQAVDGEAWHGPALREILQDVGAAEAAATPVPLAHSIWEIVLHLIATQRLLLRRLDGDATARDLPPEEDWPPVRETDEAAWQETLPELFALDERFRNRVAAFPEESLDIPLIPGGSSAYNNFHGYVQHNLYHAGQMVLLRKAWAATRQDSRR